MEQQFVYDTWFGKINKKNYMRRGDTQLGKSLLCPKLTVEKTVMG